MAALAKKGTLCISAEWKCCVGIYWYAEIQVLMVSMKSFCMFTTFIFRVMIEHLAIGWNNDQRFMQGWLAPKHGNVLGT